MGETYPGRNMWVAVGIQTTGSSVAQVFTYYQPTEVGGFLAEYATIEGNRRLGTRFTGLPYLGTKEVPFSFTVEANPDDIGRILLAALGSDTRDSVASTSSTAFTHTFKFTEDLPYVTVLGFLAGIADSVTTDRQMRLTGGKISQISIKGGTDDVMTLAVEGLAMAASAMSAVTATFTTETPWFLNSAQGTGTLSIGSTIASPGAFSEAREFEITINNAISSDHRIHGSNNPVSMGEGSSDYTGRMVAVYNRQSVTEINNFAAGNIRAITLSATGSAIAGDVSSRVKTLSIGIDKCRYTGSAPSYDPDVITIELPFKAEVSLTSTYISVINDKSLAYSAAS